MTFSDYLLDSVLILIVFRQIRESRFDRRAVLLPLVIVGIVAHSYLHSIPTSGNDLVLICALTLFGLTLGTVSALATRVRADGGTYGLVKAGAVSAGLWVLGMGSRMAFAIWAGSANGKAHIGSFGFTHHLSSDVWTAALVLMALAEVGSRVGVLYVRSHRAVASFAPSGVVLMKEQVIAA
jgi:hypothetical protein